jgi:hypothetical protein
LQEATLVLATIVKSFAMRLAPDHSVWPLLRVTLRPAGGIPMTLRWMGGQQVHGTATGANGALAEHEPSQEARQGPGG